MSNQFAPTKTIDEAYQLTAAIHKAHQVSFDDPYWGVRADCFDGSWTRIKDAEIPESLVRQLLSALESK